MSLNLREALTLHKLLGRYLPDTVGVELDVLEYSRRIIDNIVAERNPEALIGSLVLMSKKSLLEIAGMNEYDRSNLFVNCVVANRLWQLNNLLRNMGYGTSDK